MTIFKKILEDGTEIDVSVSGYEMQENSPGQLELLVTHRAYMARRRLVEALRNEIKVNWPMNDNAKIVKIGEQFDASNP